VVDLGAEYRLLTQDRFLDCEDFSQTTFGLTNYIDGSTWVIVCVEGCADGTGRER
jgi:hypothetical protein